MAVLRKQPTETRGIDNCSTTHCSHAGRTAARPSAGVAFVLLGLRLCIWHQKARPLAVRAFWGSQSDRWKVDPSRKISNGKSSAAMRAYETVCFFKKVLIATWDWLHLCLRSLSDQDTVCRSKRACKHSASGSKAAWGIVSTCFSRPVAMTVTSWLVSPT